MAGSCFAFVKDAVVDQARESARKYEKKTLHGVKTFVSNGLKARNKEFQDFIPEKKEFRSLHRFCSCAESRNTKKHTSWCANVYKQWVKGKK